MAKALITGGAGFIGSHLAEELLNRGDEVYIIDDLSTGSRGGAADTTGGRRAASAAASTEASRRMAGVTGPRHVRRVDRDVALLGRASCRNARVLRGRGVVVQLVRVGGDRPPRDAGRKVRLPDPVIGGVAGLLDHRSVEQGIDRSGRAGRR